ncbi:hypothetical protein GQ53DRAFT_261909 [Thozetella sp. PMI_491]|nr:hypothetical protein GQ53DRAFT_261909 [Thozetella sp. PMI_491]
MAKPGALGLARPAAPPSIAADRPRGRLPALNAAWLLTYLPARTLLYSRRCPSSRGIRCLACDVMANLDSLPPTQQIRRIVSSPARLAQRSVQRLHGWGIPASRQLKPQPAWRLRLRRISGWRQRVASRRREPRLPAGDAQLEGPVQRCGAQRTREPKRPAGGRYSRQGQNIKRRESWCLARKPSPRPAGYQPLLPNGWPGLVGAVRIEANMRRGR